jgi:acetyl-CoA C-acetyltransferase
MVFDPADQTNNYWVEDLFESGVNVSLSAQWNGKAVAKAGLKMEDISFYELNEAFSVVGLANCQLMNLKNEQVNVLGGAVALGHPLGNSGSRIIVTLLNVLNQNNAQYGAAGICNGGGGASAIVIERL